MRQHDQSLHLMPSLKQLRLRGQGFVNVETQATEPQSPANLYYGTLAEHRGVVKRPLFRCTFKRHSGVCARRGSNGSRK